MNAYVSIFLWITNYRLVVENIGVEDDGVYTISASNSVGETIATAKLVCHSKIVET